jgi:hypothetical protein
VFGAKDLFNPEQAASEPNMKAQPSPQLSPT